MSGEYAMILNAAENQILDLKAVLSELCISYRRAGVDLLISYFTPELLEILKWSILVFIREYIQMNQH